LKIFTLVAKLQIFNIIFHREIAVTQKKTIGKMR